MANAKKCDRCGAYYDTNTKHKTRNSVNGGIINNIEIKDKFGYTDEFFDLCDECITKLYEFLENKR